jgi:predicted site-specific integrase-resolvase
LEGEYESVATVRRWCKNGKFSRVIRTIGNQRRFDPGEVHEILHPNLDKRIMVGYARVSSYDQRSDLAAQAERLSQYGCQLVIKDLGSGLNCKKPGLKRLLRLLLLHRIGTLVLTHDDRLLRFGTELIYFIANLMGTHIVILDEPQQQSFETELVKDVITLMTVFCARLYGKRSWKNKVKENTGIKNLSFR